MVKKTYLELTADEVEILEKAKQIMSEIANETKDKTAATIGISDYDAELITSVVKFGVAIFNHRDAFYIIH